MIDDANHGEERTEVSEPKIEENPDKKDTCTKCELIKWLIGIIGLGLFGNLISCEHNKSLLDLQRMDTDSKLITAITTKFDTKPAFQLSYLVWIKPFVTTDVLRDGIAHSIDSLSKIAVQTISSVAKADIDSSAKKVQNSLSKTQLEFFAAQARIDNNPKKTIAPTRQMKFDDNIDDTVARNNPISGGIDAAAIKNIQNATPSISPQVVDDYKIQGTPETYWCKKGYYVIFNHTLQIGVNNLNAPLQTVYVNALTLPDNTVLTNLTTLVVGSPVTIMTNDAKYKYVIILNNIGAGGFNPFTKAAYITVATYKK